MITKNEILECMDGISILLGCMLIVVLIPIWIIPYSSYKLVMGLRSEGGVDEEKE